MLIVSSYSSIYAKCYFEPNINYTKSSYQIKTLSELEGKGEMTGTSLGLKVGYQLPVLIYFGLDATYDSGKYKSSDSITVDSDIVRTSAYGVIGIQFPVLLRFYVGTALIDNETAKVDSNKTELKAKGTKIGLGYNLLPFVSLNIDYTMREFTKVKFQNDDTTYDIKDIYKEFKTNILSVGLGIRF